MTTETKTKRATSMDPDYAPGSISAFPLAIDGDDVFIRSANDAESLLAAGISWKSEQIQLADGANFPLNSGVLRIGAELIFYERRRGNIFDGLDRGFAGTSRSHHPMNTRVTAPCVADMFNAVRDSVMKVQAKTGMRADLPNMNEGATLWSRVAFLKEKWFKPRARFGSKNSSGYGPLGVQFTDLSIGEPVRWLWEFGDGSISTDQHPFHIYESSGSYDVALTIYTAADVTEVNGVSAMRKRNYVNVLPATDIDTILFYVRNLSSQANHGLSLQGVKPLRMLFVDQTGGAIKTRIWSFGDGNTLAIDDPYQYSVEYTYVRSGVFVPSLTVSDGVRTLRRSLDAQIEVTVA